MKPLCPVVKSSILTSSTFPPPARLTSKMCTRTRNLLACVEPSSSFSARLQQSRRPGLPSQAAPLPDPPDAQPGARYSKVTQATSRVRATPRENARHKQVCNGTLTLKQAQRLELAYKRK